MYHKEFYMYEVFLCLPVEFGQGVYAFSKGFKVLD
jgi:hypothetical protein